MNSPESPLMLSAAECAARTGLSTRALRLYEEQKLLSPRRSPGGWRQYGAPELLRLNNIVLLKVAGLTLAQIATVLTGDEREPVLVELLTLQLKSWKTRREEAERGQRVVEAALERLHRDRSLSIDDLCNLIRSLEMTQPPEKPTQGADADGPTDQVVIQDYVGLYQAGDWNVLSIRCEDEHLVMERQMPPSLELRRIGECDFEAVGPDLQVTFDRDAAGNVSQLRMRLKGGDMEARRIDAAVAEQVNSRLAARIKEARALPGSEAVMRRFADSLMAGQPHYEEMHPALAYAARWQLPSISAHLARLGAIRSIAFQGVGNAGWDVYDVEHEHGNSRFRILFRSDGLMTGALFTVKDGPISVGP